MSERLRRAARLSSWAETYLDTAAAEPDQYKRRMMEQFARDLRIAAKTLRTEPQTALFSPSAVEEGSR